MRLVLIDREPLFGIGLARALTMGPQPGRVSGHASFESWLEQHRARPEPVDIVIVDLQTLGGQLHQTLAQLQDLLPGVVRVVAVRDPSDLLEPLPGSVGLILRTLPPIAFVRQLETLLITQGRRLPWHQRAYAPALNVTPRQLEVLALITRGESNKRIAFALNIAERTVKLHVTALLKYLGASNRTQIVIRALELGLAEGELQVFDGDVDPGAASVVEAPRVRLRLPDTVPTE